MPAPFTPRSAKNAKVRIDTFAFTSKKWTVTPKADKIDTTHFESGGYAASISGIVSIEFSIEADYDAANNPYDLPVGLQPGIDETGSEPSPTHLVKLYLNDLTGPYWQITAANVWEAPMTADVKGALGISLKGEGTGTFIFPSGPA